MQWCEELEDMLQCPICMMCPPNVHFYQCTEGHHICKACKQQVGMLCPTCRSNWTGYRNRLAEHMCSKFDDIKISLIDPEAEINKLLIPDTFCIGTQTDNVQDATIDVDSATVDAANVTADLPATKITDHHRGTYPCRIGLCKAQFDFEPLMQHIKAVHADHFVEFSPPKDLLFTFDWCFNHTCNYIFARVIRIREVGTFILKVSTDKCGDVCGYIMMIHDKLMSKLFSYRLELSDGLGHRFSSFTGNVNSCRSPATVFENQCLKVTGEDIVKVKNEQSTMIAGTFFLARKLQWDDVQMSKPDRQKKRRAKNRNKTTKEHITVASQIS